MLTNTAQEINFVIDFDSTFTKVEGLDELAAIALKGHKDRDKIVGQIRTITDRGMVGEIGFAAASISGCAPEFAPASAPIFDLHHCTLQRIAPMDCAAHAKAQIRE